MGCVVEVPGFIAHRAQSEIPVIGDLGQGVKEPGLILPGEKGQIVRVGGLAGDDQTGALLGAKIPDPGHSRHAFRQGRNLIGSLRVVLEDLIGLPGNVVLQLPDPLHVPGALVVGPGLRKEHPVGLQKIAVAVLLLQL